MCGRPRGCCRIAFRHRLLINSTTGNTSFLSLNRSIKVTEGHHLFFVSSLFVKKPSRIQGLLMVMTLALLVYSVAQRRLRRELVRQNETIPNQINHPTNRPTLRWVFQVLEGIERVRVKVAGQGQELITGLNEVKITILRLFGEQVCHVYQLPSG